VQSGVWARGRKKATTEMFVRLSAHGKLVRSFEQTNGIRRNFQEMRLSPRCAEILETGSGNQKTRWRQPPSCFMVEKLQFMQMLTNFDGT
jgi:hypothetical protein